MRSLTVLGALLALLQFVVQLVVFVFERAAVECHNLAEALERGLELLLRVVLRAARRAHPLDQNVALLPAELLHGPVVDRVAASQRQGGRDHAGQESSGGETT